MAKKMEIIRDPQSMQDQALQWRAEGQRIVLVPTMGYFHPGHLSLMKYGRTQADRLVVSLFVNPTQFSPTEDLDRYPRDWARDFELAKAVGVDLMFTPPPEQIYPPGYQTYVAVEGLTQRLCGASRPGHFRGVTTIVMKLFNLVQPQVAVFGEKDYQQLIAIQRMVLDLNLPVAVIGRPLVREPDGLAMSSRNAYLSQDQRQAALCLYKGILAARELVATGELSAPKITEAVRQIITHTPHTTIDYVAVVDPLTLEEVETIQGAARLALAVWVGNTRLIDNTLLEESCLCCV